MFDGQMWTGIAHLPTNTRQLHSDQRSKEQIIDFGWYGHQTAMHSSPEDISRHEQQPNQENQVGDTCTQSHVT